jgi:hypothetical protein
MYSSNIPITNTVAVLGDTLLTNGQTYRIVKDTERDGPYPGSTFSYIRVDTLGQVWRFFSSVCGERVLYRLNAHTGDTLSNSCSSGSQLYWELIERTRAIVFNDTTEVQTWEWVNSPLLGVVTLAGRYGLIIERGEGWERYLRGALINGKTYGVITVSVPHDSDILPSDFVLFQNYPNPFNPSTTISYELPRRGHVKIIVFDLLGREVATLVNEQNEAGRYRTEWNGKDRNNRQVPSGAYFYRIEVNRRMIVKKMITLR